ncbi:MAG: hypothetical protein NT003_01770 [Candidatus Magasanikbacteria bacterium]|nr:hypothetical protein [Candidatus Magasanikbacteria bacterium]
MQVVLKKLGLSDKEIAVYTALLALGSASVRQIADAAKVNRGTTYDILKSLMADGLISYINQDKKHFFSAEDPAHLKGLVQKQKDQLSELDAELEESISELQSLHKRGGEKPVVRYFEGKRGVRALLTDVLAAMETAPEKLYYVYSSSGLREQYREAYPTFTEDRITKNIRMQAIALGSGGSTSGLDERKWLTQEEGSPTYTLIYHGHIAHIANDAGGGLVGVIIENDAIYQTQKTIFQSLWKTLK